MAIEINSFDKARVVALKQYAEIELELVRLLHNLLNVDHAIASAILFQITNTRSRYAIISSILEIKFNETWKLPWKMLEKWLVSIDSRRNHIVHWLEEEFIVINFDAEKNEIEDVETQPYLANSSRKWRAMSSKELIYKEGDILEVANSARVISRIMNRYNCSISEPDDWPWTDIFQKPIAHQTPVEFLQLLNDRGHPAQLPPYHW